MYGNAKDSGQSIEKWLILNLLKQPFIWGGMLILKGICTRCGNPVARVIENE